MLVELIVVVAFGVFACAAILESRGPMWKEICKLYKTKKSHYGKPSLSAVSMYFGRMGCGEEGFYNAMTYYVEKRGLYIRPPIIKFWNHPILIPWCDIEEIRSVEGRMFRPYIRILLKDHSIFLDVPESLVKCKCWMYEVK